MIRNEKEYKVTKSWVDRFESSASALDDRLQQHSDPLVELERNGLRGQLETLKGEVAEYELLRSGSARAVPYDLEDLPGALIRRRLSLGLSELDVAKRLGLSEQEVQEYERTDYDGAGSDVLTGALSALSVNGDEDALRGVAADFEAVLARLSRAGLDREFVAAHILYEPAVVRSDAVRVRNKMKLLARLGSLFGWTIPQVMGDCPLALDAATPGPRARPPRQAPAPGHTHGICKGHGEDFGQGYTEAPGTLRVCRPARPSQEREKPP